MQVTLRESLYDSSLDVMNFLNEVVLSYPDAVSFAPGRPSEAFFDVEQGLGQIQRYVEYRADMEGLPPDAIFARLGQYGKTNGVIQELVARHLRRDEQIDVYPEAIMLTSGCQEAMLILLIGLFEPANDVLLVSDPTYIGITGPASILTIPVLPIATGEDGLEPASLVQAIAEVKRAGKRPRAVYDIPNFNNPLGTSMPLGTRRQLLEIAHKHHILVFEDNPYGMFAYDGDPLPTLKSIDENGVVIYLGSFSKTVFPGLRLGYLVADQRVQAPQYGGKGFLAEELSRVKSLTTVNTSTLSQAVVGGILLAYDGSLSALVQEKLPFYKANRDYMLHSLKWELQALGLPPAAVRWNRPSGGFFLTVTLPFDFDEHCLHVCAQEYGVICCPMSFFSVRQDRTNQIRLSFSYVSKEQIGEGVRRLGRFVRDRLRV
jgi:(S)-3,5-dihydroxyphenylglycine transaminase